MSVETQPESKPEPQPKSASQIVRNVLVNWTAFLVTLLTGFWMSPFLIRELGDSEYGVWVLTGSLVGYLGLLDFGVTQSTVKYIAEYRAKNDQEAINRVVTGSLFVFSIVGLVSLVASVLLGLVFNRVFHTTISDSTAALVVFLVGLNLAITFPASVFMGVLRGYQRYDIGAAAGSVSILLRTGFIVWAILQGYGLVALAALTLIFDVGRLAYVVWRAYGLNPDIRIGREHYRRDELAKLFGHSVWVFLIMVGDQINFATDTVVIGLFLPPAFITVYSIAFRLIGYLRSLVVEMVGVLMPAVSGMHASDDSAGISDLLVAGAKFTLLLALPPAAVFFVLGDQFIRLWVGPDFGQSAILLNILTVGIIAHLCEMTVTTVLVGMGRANVVAKFVLSQAAVNLALSLLLIRPYGLMGVAIGTSASMALFAIVSIPYYLHKHLKLSVSDFVSRAILPPLWVQIPWVVGLILLRDFVPMPSMSAFFGALLLPLPFYALLVYARGLNPTEKAAFSSLSGRFGFKRATPAQS